MRSAVILLVILSLSIACSANAQVLSLRSYTTRDGLIANRINALMQDARGYLWIGTSDGVSVYDGATFTNYTTQDGLSNSFITAIRESKRRPGTIWLGAINGGLTKYANGRFTPISVGMTVSSNTITSLAEDSSGVLWCGTAGGLFRVEHDSAVEVETPAASQREWTLDSDSQGRVWAGYGRQVHIFRTTTQKPAVITPPLAHNEHIELITADPDGDMWIGGSLGTILLYRDTSVVARRSMGSSPLAIVHDRRNDIWLSTVKGQLLKMKKDEFPTALPLSYGAEQGFPRTGGTPLLDDREGNIWFATYQEGLIKLVDEALQTVPVKAYTNFATADSADHLWLPAEGGVWEVWNDDTRCRARFHPLGERKDIPPETPLVIDRQGRLWAASPTYLHCYTITRRGEASHLQLVDVVRIDHLSRGKSILRAYVDHNNMLWCSVESLVVRVDVNRRPRVVSQLRFPGDVPLASVRAISMDRRGDVWLGDFYRGLVRLRGETITHYTRAQGLADDGVRSFAEDAQGRLWIGTRYGGVSIWDGQTFQSISMKNGLPSNCVWWIARDSSGAMWLATSLGLIALQMDGSKKVLGTTTGQNIDFCAATHGAAIWFGNGLTLLGMYNPTRERVNLVPPPAYITQFAVNDSVVSVGESRQEFSYDRNNISIQYIGISLKDERNVQYQFRLNDAEWSKPTRQRSISFSALSPGSYTFDVRAINADGIVSERPAHIAFTIRPPFWQQWWFLLAAACVLGGLVYLAYLYRVRQLLQVERLRTRIATDLHDDIGASLTRIALLSDIAKDEAQRAAPHLTEVAARIGTDARDLLEAVSTLVWSIDPRHDQFDDLLTMMKDFAQDMFEGKRITYNFSADPSLSSCRISVETRRNLLLIYKEAVNNIVRHSRCTEVHVDMTIRGDNLVLVITDNGLGLAASAGRVGHGIANMQRRTATLGGTFSIMSPQGKGTCVEVHIPVSARTKSTSDT
jgi:ligand-binding sensor domain-containing protein/signal transduction histidine kinase